MLFNVYHNSTHGLYTVYSVLKNDEKTLFLIYSSNSWHWIDANEFHPA